MIKTITDKFFIMDILNKDKELLALFDKEARENKVHRIDIMTEAIVEADRNLPDHDNGDDLSDIAEAKIWLEGRKERDRKVADLIVKKYKNVK